MRMQGAKPLAGEGNNIAAELLAVAVGSLAVVVYGVAAQRLVFAGFVWLAQGGVKARTDPLIEAGYFVDIIMAQAKCDDFIARLYKAHQIIHAVLLPGEGLETGKGQLGIGLRQRALIVIPASGQVRFLFGCRLAAGVLWFKHDKRIIRNRPACYQE
ncbi:MAG: hypothetical protein CSA54_03465 [Gammaproteobacteria bacterium]|nr:MAG: hypothetical protein CSA54_03465 [Gammaproteobacteria bacterium]